MPIAIQGNKQCKREVMTKRASERYTCNNRLACKRFRASQYLKKEMCV